MAKNYLHNHISSIIREKINTFVWVSTPSAIVHSGYFFHITQSSRGHPDKRYIILTEQALLYYKDDFSSSPHTVYLINPHSRVEKLMPVVYFEIEVTFIPGQSIIIGTETAKEQDEWFSAINKVIENSSSLARSFFDAKGASLGYKWKRYFFVLHREWISGHSDLQHLNHASFTFSIEPSTYIEVMNDPKIFVIHSSNDEMLIMQHETTNEVQIWINAINQTVKQLRIEHNYLSENMSKFIEEAKEKTLIKSYISFGHAAKNSSITWTRIFMIIYRSHLLLLSDESSNNLVQAISIRNNSSIYKMSQGPEYFKLSADGMIFFFKANDERQQSEWLTFIYRLIIWGEPDKLVESNKLFAEKLRQLDNDQTQYSRISVSHQSLSLEKRCGEWAILSLPHEQGGPYSAILAINGNPVSRIDFDSVVENLSHWNPPVEIDLISPPKKNGVLKRLCRGTTLSGNIQWKRRYVTLIGDKLKVYRHSEDLDRNLKDTIDLSGAVVNIVPWTYSEQLFCFRVASNTEQFFFQASSINEMNEWVACIFHSIAIADGGGYLRQQKTLEEILCDKIKSNSEKIILKFLYSLIERQRSQKGVNRSKSVVLNGMLLKSSLYFALLDLKEEEESKGIAEEIILSSNSTHRIKENMLQGQTAVWAFLIESGQVEFTGYHGNQIVAPKRRITPELDWVVGSHTAATTNQFILTWQNSNLIFNRKILLRFAIFNPSDYERGKTLPRNLPIKKARQQLEMFKNKNRSIPNETISSDSFTKSDSLIKGPSVPYEILKSDDPPSFVLSHQKEIYLSDEEFEKVFEISREEFFALPSWRQVELKKKNLLF